MENKKENKMKNTETIKIIICIFLILVTFANLATFSIKVMEKTKIELQKAQEEMPFEILDTSK